MRNSDGFQYIAWHVWYCVCQKSQCWILTDRACYRLIYFFFRGWTSQNREQGSWIPFFQTLYDVISCVWCDCSSVSGMDTQGCLYWSAVQVWASPDSNSKQFPFLMFCDWIAEKTWAFSDPAAFKGLKKRKRAIGKINYMCS